MNPATLVLALALTPAASVDLVDRVGTAVPADVRLVDHRGRATTVGELLDGRTPLVLVPAYFRCPMLCGLTISSVAEALAEAGIVPGTGVRVATISFDPRDHAADAERARARAIDLYGAEVDDHDWSFATGEPDQVARLMDAIGFRYVFDEATDQYAHSSAVFFVAPDGVLTRVLPGVDIPVVDLRLAIAEAGRAEVTPLAERALLTCFRFDPVTRRYGFWVFGFLRVAGIVMLALFGTGLLVLVRRDRRRQAREGARWKS